METTSAAEEKIIFMSLNRADRAKSAISAMCHEKNKSRLVVGEMAGMRMNGSTIGMHPGGGSSGRRNRNVMRRRTRTNVARTTRRSENG